MFPTTRNLFTPDGILEFPYAPNGVPRQVQERDALLAYEQTCISVVYTDDAGRITRYVDYWNPLVPIEALTPGQSADDPDLAVKFGS